jgi:hypothetical protein
LQHDYILGNYPVGRDDAAQLSALQILVEIGFVDTPESCTWVFLLLYLTSLYPIICHLCFCGVLLAFVFMLIGSIGEFIFTYPKGVAHVAKVLVLEVYFLYGSTPLGCIQSFGPRCNCGKLLAEGL